MTKNSQAQPAKRKKKKADPPANRSMLKVDPPAQSPGIYPGDLPPRRRPPK